MLAISGRRESYIATVESHVERFFRNNLPRRSLSHTRFERAPSNLPSRCTNWSQTAAIKRVKHIGGLARVVCGQFRACTQTPQFENFWSTVRGHRGASSERKMGVVNGFIRFKSGRTQRLREAEDCLHLRLNSPFRRQ